jgi:anion-transporting  ArsA/GET3 family ATPase
MKKLAFITVLLLLISTFANAQNPRSGGQRLSVEERAKMTTDWMVKELNLTPEQIAPIDSINLLFAKAQQVIFQSSDGDREKIRETMEALEKEKETTFSVILTPEQLDLYKKKRDEMTTNRRRRQ